MADPAAAAPLTLDLSSLLVGGGGTATLSGVAGYLLSQWKGKRNGDSGSSKIEQKIDEMVSGQRELTAELHDLNGEFREFIGYMKASVK